MLQSPITHIHLHNRSCVQFTCAVKQSSLRVSLHFILWVKIIDKKWVWEVRIASFPIIPNSEVVTCLKLFAEHMVMEVSYFCPPLQVLVLRSWRMEHFLRGYVQMMEQKRSTFFPRKLAGLLFGNTFTQHFLIATGFFFPLLVILFY